MAVIKICHVKFDVFVVLFYFLRKVQTNQTEMYLFLRKYNLPCASLFSN